MSRANVNIALRSPFCEDIFAFVYLNLKQKWFNFVDETSAQCQDCYKRENRRYKRSQSLSVENIFCLLIFSQSVWWILITAMWLDVVFAVAVWCSKKKTVCASLNILWDNIILAYSYLSLKQLSCHSPHEQHSLCQVALNESNLWFCYFIIAAISMVFEFLFFWWNADWSKVKIASIWCYTF